MGFRFRKSMKVAPGVSLNFSKGGVSASAGPRGAKVNVSKNGVRGSVGIPGSGVSYSQTLYKTKKKSSKEQSKYTKYAGIVLFVLVLLGIMAWKWFSKQQG